MTEPKKQFELKKARKGNGYETPEGKVFSWNDFARFFCNEIAYKKGFENKKARDEHLFDPSVIEVTAHYDSTKTAIGTAYWLFVKYLNTSIYDGRIALLQREGVDNSEMPQDFGLPPNLREGTTAGFMLSAPEVLEVFKDFLAENIMTEDERLQTGLRQWHEFLNKAFDAIPDYSDVDFKPLNSPVPLNKVKNRPSHILKHKAQELMNKSALS